MINNLLKSENRIGQNIYNKIDNLSSELVEKKILDKCSPFDKKKICVIINEIRYEANRMRNKTLGM